MVGAWGYHEPPRVCRRMICLGHSSAYLQGPGKDLRVRIYGLGFGVFGRLGFREFSCSHFQG